MLTLWLPCPLVKIRLNKVPRRSPLGLSSLLRPVSISPTLASTEKTCSIDRRRSMKWKTMNTNITYVGLKAPITPLVSQAVTPSPDWQS